MKKLIPAIIISFITLLTGLSLGVSTVSADTGSCYSVARTGDMEIRTGTSWTSYDTQFLNNGNLVYRNSSGNIVEINANTVVGSVITTCVTPTHVSYLYDGAELYSYNTTGLIVDAICRAVQFGYTYGCYVTPYEYNPFSINDKTSNGNNLTNNGGTEVTSALPFANSAKALDLERDNSQNLSATDSASLSVTGDMTVELWIKPESLPANGASYGLVSRYGSSGNRSFFYDLLRDDSRNGGNEAYYIRMYVSNNGTSLEDHYVRVYPTAGTWTHLAILFDASAHSMQVYQDGVSQGTDNTGTITSIYDGTADFTIGSDGTINYFDGVIDEVRVWNDLRVSTEITNNKSNELTGIESGLVAYYAFENLVAFSINDKTSNGNNLTNNGGTEVTSSLPFANSTKARDLERDNSQNLSAADSTSLSITGDMTVELWIKPEALPINGASYGLVSRYGSSGNRSFFYDLLRDDSRNGGNEAYYIRMYVSNNGTYLEDHYVRVYPTAGTWTHLAILFNASAHSMQVYQDGTSQGTDSTGTITSIYDGTADFTIGSDGTINYFDGVIDDVRVWNDLRTSTEITNNKSDELAGSESNLAAYYPL